MADYVMEVMLVQPCRFCGASRSTMRGAGRQDRYVQCEGCGAEGEPAGTATAAVVQWNQGRVWEGRAGIRPVSLPRAA